MKEETFVSVIIATFNVEKYIEYTLQSLVEQTYKKFEVIIIDDGSTDSTIAKIHKFDKFLNINLVQYAHCGNVGKNRNRALKLAKGQYIHFLDGDDAWEPNKMERCQSSFNNNVKLVCSNAKIIDSDNVLLNHRLIDSVNFNLDIKLHELVKVNFIIASSVSIKKEIVNDYFRFDEVVGAQGEDYFFWLRVLEKYSALFIDETLVKYRIHQNNLSFRSTEYRIKLLKRTISLRENYFSYNDPKVQLNSRLGSKLIYTELSMIYFKEKDYVNAYKSMLLMSFDPGQIGYKNFIYYVFIFSFLFIINLLKKLKSS